MAQPHRDTITLSRFTYNRVLRTLEETSERAEAACTVEALFQLLGEAAGRGLLRDLDAERTVNPALQNLGILLSGWHDNLFRRLENARRELAEAGDGETGA